MFKRSTQDRVEAARSEKKFLQSYFFSIITRHGKRRAWHLEHLILLMLPKWKAQHDKVQNNRTMQSHLNEAKASKFKIQQISNQHRYQGKLLYKQAVYDEKQPLKEKENHLQEIQSIHYCNLLCTKYSWFWPVEKEITSAAQKSNCIFNTLKQFNEAFGWDSFWEQSHHWKSMGILDQGLKNFLVTCPGHRLWKIY